MNVPKAHIHDPRTGAFRPYSPHEQYDEAILARIGGEHMLDFREFAKRSGLGGYITRLQQITYILTLTDLSPQLLIPYNKRRKSFVIANPFNVFLAFSYGLPPPGATGMEISGFGAPFYQESCGLVSIDDIYVTPGFVGSGAVVVGYEGTLAIQ